MNDSVTASGAGTEVSIERIFAAPRDLVFDCLTKAEHLTRWWGPRCFESPDCESDPRPGGAIKLDMHGPEPYGVNPVRGEFLEVERPGRLVFVLRAFPGDEGSWGIEHVTTMVFDTVAEGTRMRMTTLVKQVSEELLPALKGMREGWSQSFDKLDELLRALA